MGQGTDTEGTDLVETLAMWWKAIQKLRTNTGAIAPFLKKKKKKGRGSVVALECCVNFYCTVK